MVKNGLYLQWMHWKMKFVIKYSFCTDFLTYSFESGAPIEAGWYNY